jgi:hypothetical protein
MVVLRSISGRDCIGLTIGVSRKRDGLLISPMDSFGLSIWTRWEKTGQNCDVQRGRRVAGLHGQEKCPWLNG